ncbi:MAG: terpene cyclase/mutase family protein [Planctomycetia bacterium]|nr:terpene cyclase/mutase family protein [Planctomycetia bacterium]
MTSFIASRSIAGSPQEAPAATKDRIAAALDRGLPPVKKAAANYPDHRKCFSCHHQTLPMLAMVTIRDFGGAFDHDLLPPAAFTHKSFDADIDNLRKGEGIGGRALTVGYGLWALSLADTAADETTEAMVTFLLKTQQEDGRWKPQVKRPPMEESSITCTVLAVAGMRKYATEVQKADVDAAIARAKAWLVAAMPENQEDRAAKLWGLHAIGSLADEERSARAAVLAAQREDGGWAQTDDGHSDAYATGQTLFVLHTTGMTPCDTTYERGVKFLLDAQHDDGSWLVETRAKPVQVYFDNGDPHGKNQFISTPASAWALAALAISGGAK